MQAPTYPLLAAHSGEMEPAELEEKAKLEVLAGMLATSLFFPVSSSVSQSNPSQMKRGSLNACVLLQKQNIGYLHDLCWLPSCCP